ncbi:MFS transporter, DHA1 family, inner membrane transport protein [Nocardiopsis flavescens]|uniref:MFS transporter, DHA1 family, inner membrane transport protein n=1 Tax=Nocardiopsis flavescens TaxID=758803 RepID=A0A1M6J9H3_9ACTN|nr:MFS transporter [Nocardiopsis flavescens]SHJ43376.1 MFS transporter, DHA1 family, inner membrane transport protein [Nocardiopsis flavescens]
MLSHDNAPRTRLVLLTLAAGTFGIGTTEFAISGLLPGIATEFGVSVTTAGWAATAYALGVFLGAPVLVLVGRRFERKRFLLALMALFVIGNLLTAFAPSFSLTLAGRVVASLTHAAFIGTGSIIASRAVPGHRRTSAIAFMFSGLTLATLIGTPVATWVSTEFSWRVSFLGISAIGLAVLAGILACVPSSRTDESFDLAAEVRALANPQLLLAMLVTVLGPAGFFTSITYIAPITMNATGTPESWIPVYMLVFGLGLFIGNILGGRLADRNLMGLLLGSLAVLTVTLLVFWLAAGSVVVTFAAVFLMAAAGFATVSPIQRLVMERAEAAGAPNLASSMNIGMFNLGNAVGAWLGGHMIGTGFGDSGPNLAGGLLAAGALAVGVLIRLRSGRPAAGRPPAGADPARSARG